MAPPRRIRGELTGAGRRNVCISGNPSTPTDRTPDRGFLVATALLFAASVAATVAGCAWMSAMDGMPMAGGWTMSMTWMRMPGQRWPGAVAMFVGMWIAMMVAMMLPSLAPALWRYRLGLAASGVARTGSPTALCAAGYFCVWTLVGIAVFALGVMLAALAMRAPALARALPAAAGAVVLLAGAVQFSAWKTRHLDGCRRGGACDVHARAGAGAAWRHGLHLGLHCSLCCAGPTATLLVVGVMDLRAMAAVTAAITFERLAPDGGRAARVVGVAMLAGGALLLARALTAI